MMMFLLTVACSGQKNESENLEPKESDKKNTTEPKETWKVDKEFDENGNLIRYDSVYSWSSHSALNDLSSLDRDSLMQTLKSSFFTNLSGFKEQGFEAVFSQDSLFSKHFFNDEFFDSDFGNDFMHIDKIRKQMLQKQKRFLEKYQSEFMKPKDEN